MAEPISATIIATKSTEVAVTTKEVSAESLKETAETIAKETPVKSVMPEIENISLESLKAQNDFEINSILEGRIHLQTEVQYEVKEVVDPEGNKIVREFPIFESMHKVDLSENMYKESDYNQFKYCNEKLKESYDKGELDKEKFTERQIEQIKNGDKPENTTWHHNENKGVMELVDRAKHENTPHTGGRSIWGGGREAR